MTKTKAVTFAYYGGKARLSKSILPHIPIKGRKFIDLFGGRGNLSFAAMQSGKFTYDNWLINDINTAPFFKFLKNLGDRKIEIPPRTEEEFKKLKEMPLTSESRWLIEPYICRNGGTYRSCMQRSAGGFRSPENYQRNLHEASRLLRKHDVKISQLDWRTFLDQQDLNENDFVFCDQPYLESKTDTYLSSDVLPVEVVKYLQNAPFRWLFCEYDEPLYRAEFGEPIYCKSQALNCTHSKQKALPRRNECLWKGPNRRTATVGKSAIPHNKKSAKIYENMSMVELCREIKLAVMEVEENQIKTVAEIRERLLPVLIALRKKTKRKKPGYYETLMSMGLNPNRVRSWFYRSHCAKEAIRLLEKPGTTKAVTSTHELTTIEEELLHQADFMAAAVLKGNYKHARHLAAEYTKVRNMDKL